MVVRVALLAICLLPASVGAAEAAGTACVGFFNQYEQGYKLEGDRLEPTGARVAPGVQLEFNGMTQVKGRSFLTRARSDVMFDAQNVELTSGCDLPDRPPPQAR